MGSVLPPASRRLEQSARRLGPVGIQREIRRSSEMGIVTAFLITNRDFYYDDSPLSQFMQKYTKSLQPFES